MDNEVILEREHGKPCKRKPHNGDEFRLGISPHDIKKAVKFFDVRDTVEQINQPLYMEKEDQQKKHKAYSAYNYG